MVALDALTGVLVVFFFVVVVLLGLLLLPLVDDDLPVFDDAEVDADAEDGGLLFWLAFFFMFRRLFDCSRTTFYCRTDDDTVDDTWSRGLCNAVVFINFIMCLFFWCSCFSHDQEACAAKLENCPLQRDRFENIFRRTGGLLIWYHFCPPHHK